ncbi:MAG: ribonuclease III [Deltaproteobacteria bacterium]|nr:ribonuclease III [Deltaproteobacteria bacterium]
MRFGIVRSGSDSQNGSSDDSDSNAKKKLGLEVQAEAPENEPLGPEHYSKIEAVLGYKFKNQSWLQRALTHRSLQLKGSKTDYERLEFLGDAVLDLAIAQLLLDRHQEAREGELSKMRAALVNTSSLAAIARTLNLGPFIRLSRGELSNGGADRPSILADVFEALMGAIHREAGYQQALTCVETLFGELLTNVEPRDPKTELQEALHAAGSEAPAYLLECVEGPEHAPTFVSVVQVDGQVVGRGRGATKKASQQAAAAEALTLLKKDDEIDEAFLKPQKAEGN